MTPKRRMLLVHAHPDDESITTGGVIARYVRAGVEVVVLTCTLGEEGEVIGEEWAGLAAAKADQLGGYRVGELTCALAALELSGPRFLGGAGRWRDSGMADTPSHAHPRAFVNADPDHAVAAMSDVIVELRPHVVVTYDPHGGYGHPDHIQAHRFTTEAIERAARTGWDTPKFYWIADTTTADQITTTVDITSVLDAKRAALRAHATQVTVAPDGMTFALSNNIPHPIHPYESFILVRGARGPVSVDGGEDDLFGGVA